MMQAYMKLMNHPETKELLSDPTFAPILSSIMSNPMEAMKHMGDPRVQKIMKVLQENMSTDQAQKAADFMKKQGGAKPGQPGQSSPSESEPMKEQTYDAPSPPPPKR